MLERVKLQCISQVLATLRPLQNLCKDRAVTQLAVALHGIKVQCQRDLMERRKHLSARLPLSVYLLLSIVSTTSTLPQQTSAAGSAATKDDEQAAMAAMFQAQTANWEETQEKMSQLVLRSDASVLYSKSISHEHDLFSPFVRARFE